MAEDTPTPKPETQTAPEGAKAETPPQSPEATAAEVMAKGNEVVKMSLDQIKKMTQQQRREMFLVKTAGNAGEYSVNFKGNQKAEKKIGLHDLFGAENPLVLVSKSSDEDAFYAERGKNGFYYKPGTEKRVAIFTGYIISIPINKTELEKFKKEADEERAANIKREEVKYLKAVKKGGEGAVFAYFAYNESGTNDQLKERADKMGKDEKYTAFKPAEFWSAVHEEFMKENQEYRDKFEQSQAKTVADEKPKVEETAPVAAEKPDFKQRLLAYINDMPGVTWTEAQRTAIANGIISFKKNFDIDRTDDRDVFIQVFKYFSNNPELSEKQLAALAIYAGMADSDKEQFVSALQENKLELKVTNPQTLNMLVKVLEESRKDPKSMSKEEWLKLMKRPGGSENSEPILASN